MQVAIKPPNKAFYDERVKAARSCLQHAEVMPPFLVTYMCYSVMHRALGGNTGEDEREWPDVVVVESEEVER